MSQATVHRRVPGIGSAQTGDMLCVSVQIGAQRRSFPVHSVERSHSCPSFAVLGTQNDESSSGSQ
jgi:hypothetical protein